MKEEPDMLAAEMPIRQSPQQEFWDIQNEFHQAREFVDRAIQLQVGPPLMGMAFDVLIRKVEKMRDQLGEMKKVAMKGGLAGEGWMR